MSDPYALRPGEKAVETDHKSDDGVRFIGRINTPWKTRKDCPRQGNPDGPECTIEVFDPWGPALQGLERFEAIEVLYWLDDARRDLVVQSPSFRDTSHGTFALRSPNRPNPIGLSSVRLVSIEGNILTVKGLDCMDGTPLIDIKPHRCVFEKDPKIIGSRDSD